MVDKLRAFSIVAKNFSQEKNLSEKDAARSLKKMIGDDPTVMKQILSQALLLEGKKQDVNKDGKVDINDVIAAMSSNGKILPFAAQAASQIAEFKSEKMV